MTKRMNPVVSSILALWVIAITACSPESPSSTIAPPTPIGNVTPSPRPTDLPTTEPTITSTLTSTSPAGSLSTLAFTSDLDGDFEIYVMNPDGGKPIQLTYNNDWDCCADWSPDGTKIVFVSTRDDNWEIYVMNADGSDQTRLTRNQSVDTHPSWSADGSRIAFSSNREGTSDIYVIDSDGSQLTRLTSNGIENSNPDWSPDGTKIAYLSVDYASNPAAGEEINVMSADGNHPIQLTRNSVQDLDPVWSPDGARIAYVSTSSHNEGETNWNILVMNEDGSGIVQLTSDTTWEYSPAWTLDGKRIAFSSCYEDGSSPTGQVCDIFIVNDDASNRRRVTDLHSNTGDPAWSPSLDYVIHQAADCTLGWTRLATDSYASVTEKNDIPNRVRSGPSRADEIIAQIYPGTSLKVIEGPKCADGLVYWKVEHKSIPGGTGWTAEGDGMEYWLEPYAP